MMIKMVDGQINDGKNGTKDKNGMKKKEDGLINDGINGMKRMKRKKQTLIKNKMQGVNSNLKIMMIDAFYNYK